MKRLSAVFGFMVLVACTADTSVEAAPASPGEGQAGADNSIRSISEQAAYFRENFDNGPPSNWAGLGLRLQDMVSEAMVGSIVSEKYDDLDAVRLNLDLAKLHATHCIENKVGALPDAGTLGDALSRCMFDDDLHFQIENTLN